MKKYSYNPLTGRKWYEPHFLEVLLSITFPSAWSVAAARAVLDAEGSLAGRIELFVFAAIWGGFFAFSLMGRKSAKSRILWTACILNLIVLGYVLALIGRTNAVYIALWIIVLGLVSMFLLALSLENKPSVSQEEQKVQGYVPR